MILLLLYFNQMVIFLLLQDIHINQFYLKLMLIFLATSLLISYCSFPSLILSSIVMINFFILSKRFFLKRKGSSDARVATMAKEEYVFSTIFIKVHKVLKVNIWWMIECNLLKVSFVLNFHNKTVCRINCNILGTAK